MVEYRTTCRYSFQQEDLITLRQLLGHVTSFGLYLLHKQANPTSNILQELQEGSITHWFKLIL